MSKYTVTASGKVWHVLRDGRFFCTASTEELARRICASLEGGRTPTVGEFTVDELIDLQDLNEKLNAKP
jgi:hypothetical protein